ncbi:MAG: SDR family oxidoreductase [Sphingobacteriales bacterium]|nr:SDR family oxidoreductase [Sphingobacteriales bacterium]
MRILILGGTGFIGKAIFYTLISKKEHEIFIGSRSQIEGYKNWKKIDFAATNNFEEILQNIDLVINAIGIIEGDFENVQANSPLKLYTICKQKSIKIINISAVGAEKEEPPTDFLRSKKTADEFILTQTNGKVIYPGIVLGEGGQSSKFFKEISTLPLIPLPDDKPLPFVHITQLTGLIEQVINNYDDFPAQIFAVSEPQKMSEVLSFLRKGKSRFLPMPTSLMQLAFTVFPNLSLGIFNKNMFTLFTEINAKDYKPIFDKATNHLVGENIKASHSLLNLLVVFSIVFIWIGTGLVSLYSWDKSLELMSEIGVTNQYAGWFVIAGSLADILLGVGMFFKSIGKMFCFYNYYLL